MTGGLLGLIIATPVAVPWIEIWVETLRRLHEKLELLRYYYLWAKPVYGV